MESVYSVPWLRRRVPEEESWLSAARAGEPWALEQFYASYRAQVYSLCYRMTGRQEDAEDAMQAAFIRAFRELPRFRGQSSVKTWVYRIAVNEVLTMRRRRRETLELDDTVGGGPDRSPTVVEGVAVRDALAQVSADHRAVLVLRFWEGLSGAEIADVLGISVPAVKMRLHRAREEFRRYYDEDRR